MHQSPRKILEHVAREYPLVVRTDYHVQIAVSNGYHDFWISKEGLKIKFCGSSDVILYHSSKAVLKKLGTYSYSTSERAALETIEATMRWVGGRTGIYADAGFKDGKAKLCVVRIAEAGTDIHTRMFSCVTSAEAEVAAVELAKAMFPGEEPIYTDYLPLAGGRVVWISRNSNKVADKFGNMRGIKDYPKLKQGLDKFGYNHS